MSNASLPIRTQSNGDAVVEICDGTTNTQKLAVNAAGSAQVAGQGVAGTPAGGVSSIQGVSGGTPVPVTAATDAYPATQNITAQDTVTTSTSQFAGQTIYTGTPTTGSVAQFTLSSDETGMLEVTGTWTGTLQNEISTDAGVTWIAHSVHIIGTSFFVSAYTGNVTGSLNLAAKTYVRVRATAAWTGTAVIKYNLSNNASTVYVANPIRLIDGSSSTSATTATIKAASTAALTTDTALVVAVSPNNVVPSNISEVLGAAVSASNPLATQISLGSSYISATNPLPVTLDPAGAGTPKNYYTDSSSVASGSNVTQSTTVGGTTGFYLQQVLLSAIGKYIAFIQTETAAGSGIFNILAAIFNSSGDPSFLYTLPTALPVATGARVQILYTNNDIVTMDLYSTVSGYQI